MKRLDYSLDEDYNRSVVTFIGEPDKVAEAALRACLKGFELIDMRKHSGAHHGWERLISISKYKRG